ncbi:MAG: tetratricopeptide repeat protein [Flavobacteriales bacterium]|nr:tetratricopeptide repeat protein [Flavobacteriales bacterium]
MKRFLFILLCFIVTSNCFSFQIDSLINIDSLNNVWNNKSNSDSERLNSLSELVWHTYNFESPDSAYKMANIQFNFAKERNLRDWMGNALIIIGRIYDKKQKYNQAIQSYQKAINLYKTHNSNTDLGTFYNDMAIIYINMNQYELALDYYDKVLEISKKNEDYDELDVYYSNMANIFARQNNFDKAFEFYSKSLSIKLENNDRVGAALIYNNLGVMYFNQSELDLAIENYTKSMNLRLMLGDKTRLITTYNNISEYYITIKSYKKAYDIASKAYELSYEYNLFDDMEFSSLYMYKSAKELGLYKKALISYELYKNVCDSLEFIKTNNRLLSIQLENNLTHQNLKDS